MRTNVYLLGCAAVIATSAVVAAAQAMLEFDVASIKPSTGGQPRVGRIPSAPGQIVYRDAPALLLVRQAYPGTTIVDLPGWAQSERYDVEVRFPPATTPEQQAQMWRRLLSQRMHLAVHDEMRERAVYRLVRSRADGTLGPQLTRSTLECAPSEPAPPAEALVGVRDAMMATIRERRTATPQEETLMQSQCRATFNAWQTLYAGGIDMKTLISGFNFLGARVDRPVVDATGLEGLFAVKLWAGTTMAGPPDPEAPPSLFSALPDQLGLKLEPATMEDRVLVVDRIDRPSPN